MQQPPQAPARQEPARPEPVRQQPDRVTLASLPADARRRFPGIAFSTHIWSEDPELRAIVANGERRREGDRVRGLTIHEITESGVVMTFERYLVEVPLAADWPGQ
jgi:general secretion pathway protein B